MRLHNLTRFAISASALAILLATPAYAQTAQGDQAATEEVAADDPAIIVTGSRFANRTAADSTVPIDVIASEQLTRGGATETNRLLN